MNNCPAHGMTIRAMILVVTTGLASAAFGAVTLNPGDDIQSYINSSPDGTTFILTPGVYRLTTGLISKSNNVFIGQPGAVINGSRLLTGWTREASNWVIQTPTQHFPSTTLRCTPASYTGCHYNDAVFYDDRPLWRVMTRGELTSGTVYIDSFTDRVYLADDPVGHKTEMATAVRAFRASQTGAVNVTIQGLVIEKFASAGSEAAVEAGGDWTILNNEIRLNHGMGLSDGKLIRGNFVHHNGELGIGGGYGSVGMLVENNEIAFNNTAGFDWYMEGGATKWFNTNGLILRGNYVHDNNGPGLWTDGDNIYTIYENNHTKNNAGPGIFHEISWDAIIRNNVVESDSLGAAGASLWWGAGIFLNSSSNVEIYGNIVTNCLHGIGGSSTDHGSSWLNGRRYLIQNVYVHDNVITQPSGIAAGFVRDSTVVGLEIFTGWNNRFDNNTYRLGNPGARNFHWMDQERTNSEWQSYGNDPHGTFIGISGSPPPPPPPPATPPTVSIASPANGATVSGTVIVNANASDSTGVAKVEFYVDGTLRATSVSSPWTFTWDSNQVGAGNHTLSVKAYAVSGSTASAAVSVTVAAPADITPPTASISSPADNSTVSGVVTVNATANDNVGVTRVQFYVDGTLQATKTSAPWSFTWNATNAAAGLHTLMVGASDAAGNTAAGSIIVTVAEPADTTPPTASISSPADNSTVSGVVTVSATANDNIGVTRVQFYVDGTPQATKTAFPWVFTWNASNAAAGLHALMVVASDAAGNTAASSIIVTVPEPADITPPTVSISAPLNNSTVAGVVTVNATANDNVGVTRVQFYVDGTLQATKTSAPWSFTWNATSAAVGSHTLMVVASDAAGNNAASSITVTVPAPADTTLPTVSISAPLNNSTVSGVVTVSAIANDDAGVTRVQFYVDGTLLATKTSAPWSFTWNATNAAPGPHTLMVVASDAAGNNGGASITVTIGPPDTTLPTAIISSPSHNSTVSGVITVNTVAYDDVGVTKVQFYVDGILTGTKTAAPWDFVWDTRQAYAGSHTLTVAAYDAAGNNDSSTIRVTVIGFIDITPPTASISSPGDNSTVSGVVTVRAVVEDDVGVTSVQFYLDGRLMETNTAAPWNFTWNTATVTPGLHNLRVVAYDAAGNHYGAVVWVTVAP